MTSSCSLAAKSYPAKDAPLASVGSWSYVLCHEQARETTAASTVAAAPRRELIHPGVLEYLGEIGR